MESSGTAAANAQRWECRTCGADLRFDAATGQMLCGHCGARGDLAIASAPAIVEHALTAEALAATPRGLGYETVSIRCGECGASVSVPPATVTATCAFCGSSHVLTEAPDAAALRPESLVPFAVTAEVARERFGTWVRGLWFRPSKLAKQAAVSELRGVYVPFFTYDAVVDARWTAERGHHYYVTEQYTAVENGKSVQRTRQVQHTRWEPAWGSRRDVFDDLLVCASRGVPADLVDRFSTFDTRELVGYQPAYLAGWNAERHGIGLEEGWAKAEAKAKATQETRCASDVGGDTHRNLRVAHAFSNTTWKHVLLPIWVAAYRFDGKVYRFLVNGRTGETVGKAPYSVVKIAFAILLAIGIAAGLYTAAQSNEPKALDQGKPYGALTAGTHGGEIG